MSTRSSALVWVVVGLIVLLLAGVGGVFGYRAWIDARAKSAVEAAADYDEATLTGDGAILETLLPPELSSAMSESDLDALTVGGEGDAWVFDDREWDGDELVALYFLEQSDGSDLELEIVYTIGSGFSGSSATVKSDSTVSAEYIDNPESEPARTELVWLDGAWRIASYQWEGQNEFERTYYRDGKSADTLLKALRKDLGVEEGSSDAETGGSTSVDLEGLDGAVEVVAAFHDALVQGDYETAYEMLPDEQKAAYGDARAFAAQVGAYGVTGYRIIESQINDAGTAVVSSAMETENGDFGYEWRLELRGDSWVAVSREITGMEDGTSDSAPLTPDQLESGELPSGHPELGTSGD